LQGTLYAVSAEVLGLVEFDAEVFKFKIIEIQEPGANVLVFVFRDGHTEEKAWRDKSRRESWTDEMRKAAHEKAKGER
jgi:hypothetical protein